MDPLIQSQQFKWAASAAPNYGFIYRTTLQVGKRGSAYPFVVGGAHCGGASILSIIALTSARNPQAKMDTEREYNGGLQINLDISML